jgi:segregation and condensation protein A
MDYLVELDVFRGPLDLLLYLVKRNEVDICDIPIAKITEQFLEYLAVLEIIDVERAGDFLVMAATLMEIKSRFLLPQDETGTEEQADPRMELVRKLVEYKKFKEAALHLEARAERQWYRIPRQPVEWPAGPNPAEQPLRQVELWDLVSAFGRLMRETLALEPQRITVDQTPVHAHMESILARLRQERRLAFSKLFTPPHTRARLVGLFLALLELIKNCRIIAEQPESFAEIWLHLTMGLGKEHESLTDRI